MSEWAIVAIPEEGCNAWRYSSQKIPHMTLLYFGEQDDPETARHIATQLQHTVNTSLAPFSAEVHSRGVLGPKSADVLFFDQAEIPKNLTEFRSLLLQDETIRKCYDSADQFPSWTPHLTLGYPDEPAKKPKEEFGPERFYSVSFDRIALWINDYDGPTFKMNYKKFGYGDSVAESLAMSDETQAFLSHSKPAPTQGYMQRPTPSNLRHHGFGKMHHSYKNRLEDVLPFALQATLELNRLQHGAVGVLDERYIREHQLALAANVKKAVGDRSATVRYDVASRPNGDWILSSVNTMTHQGTAETCIRPIMDDSGAIVHYQVVPGNVPEEDLRYSLMHYGVRGMKWGVRRKSKDSGSDGAPSKKQIQSEAKAELAKSAADARVAKIKGAVFKEANQKAAKKQARKEIFSRPVTEDAATAASGRGRVGKHGTDAMSNKDLQALVHRMNLEQQYANLKNNEKAAQGRNAGKAYVNDLLKDVGREMASEAIKYAATEGLKYAFGAGRNAASNAAATRRARADIIRPNAIGAPLLALEGPKKALGR